MGPGSLLSITRSPRSSVKLPSSRRTPIATDPRTKFFDLRRLTQPTLPELRNALASLAKTIPSAVRRHDRVRMKIVLVLAAACCLQARSEDLGRIEFPTSGPPEARKPFMRRGLFLQSFENDDAREQFQIAREIAPGFAMAAWGEAMSYNEPIWFSQDRDSALIALSRLAAPS